MITRVQNLPPIHRYTVNASSWKPVDLSMKLFGNMQQMPMVEVPDCTSVSFKRVPFILNFINGNKLDVDWAGALYFDLNDYGDETEDRVITIKLNQAHPIQQDGSLVIPYQFLGGVKGFLTRNHMEVLLPGCKDDLGYRLPLGFASEGATLCQIACNGPYELLETPHGQVITTKKPVGILFPSKEEIEVNF